MNKEKNTTDKKADKGPNIGKNDVAQKKVKGNEKSIDTPVSERQAPIEREQKSKKSA